MALTIALTYDLKPDDPEDSRTADGPPDDLAEFWDEDTLVNVEQAIISQGHKPIRVGNIFKLVKALAAEEHKHWDLVFNVAEGYHGTSREAQLPGLLEAYQIPFTFSDAATLALIHDKGLAKVFLTQSGIDTAPFVTIRRGDPIPDLDAEGWQRRFHTYQKREALIFSPETPAAFVKPAMEGSSKGIYSFNKAHNAKELNSALWKLRQRFPTQDLIIEPFLPGREFTVSLLGSGREACVLGTLELKFEAESTTDFLGREIKQDENNLLESIVHSGGEDSTSKDPLVEAAETLALETWRAVGCCDAGRVDIRCQGIGKEARPYVLEINALAHMRKDMSALPITATRAGMDYASLIDAIIQSALQRTRR